ncbi:MAG: hypothetical protein Q8R04_01785 [Nanoarchaeota archaeon]|nr:hypothetical protein [Nanoarchaeota archaeon]
MHSKLVVCLDTQGLETRIEELFSLKVDLPVYSKDILAYALAQSALKNMYLVLVINGIEAVKANAFFPEGLAPLLEGLSASSFSPEELKKNAATFADFRGGIVRQTKKNPEWFVSLMKNFPNIKVGESGKSVYESLSDDDKVHANVGTTIAYLAMPTILRDVSREIAGNGRYIINFSPSGKPVSKRMREVLDNNAGFKDTVIRWQNLGGHAMHFFNMDKLELLVGEGDVWSDINVIEGYPHVADANKLADQFLRYGYECRERFNPIVHEFNINGQGKTKYKGGQSIASVRVADLRYPNKGFEYLIRHTDSTISVGRLYIPDETQRVTISASNLDQYIQEKSGTKLIDPFMGLALLVAAFGRDMMIYDTKEKDYKVGRRAYRPSDNKSPEPIELWLPQTKYVYNTDPSKAGSEHYRLSELIREISPHYRSPHKMKLPQDRNPSPEQLALAAKEGYPLPQGNYTYRKGTWVGEEDEKMVHQFKSRSAGAVLFGAR